VVVQIPPGFVLIQWKRQEFQRFFRI